MNKIHPLNQPRTPSRRFNPASYQYRMVQGAIIATLLIGVFFLAGVLPANASNSFQWLTILLLLGPAAGAAGGMVYHATASYRNRGGWIMLAAHAFSLLVFTALLILAILFSLGT